MSLESIKKGVGRIERVFLYLSGIIFLAMMFLGAADVLGRYFFNSPIRGTMEISSIMMGAMVFLCWGITQRAKGHVSVELLVSHYSPRTRAITDLCALLLSFVLFAVCIQQSSLIALTAFQESRVLPTLGYPTYPFYALVPIGATLLCIELVLQMVDVVASIKKG